MARYAIPALALLLIACAWTTADPTKRYADEHISFSHPASWSTYKFPGSGLHWNPIVYVSTQELRDPCERTPSYVSCAWPLTRLRPGGVLATWFRAYRGAHHYFGYTGRRITVGGRLAKIRTKRRGICRQIGADVTIEVFVRRPEYDFQACLRAPGLAANERRIKTLLASTAFPAYVR